ncbi:winged helix-turn-helix domain-containing protein [Arthrobacter sp. PAMC25284]|uniref:winged helix-turn-helix domain-containing protein n=1 Tax=Arthrobacter sp. PAMC25284 TaxID=2861279 RepID=UPI001C62781C|nr:winged helix-turn-helix domain-containing protein [Arthrobacter sp. PAMC25284]QYF88833.1 winged helix-turn-helix domain-containing protein [Arthrobacter sp. PAMC25284]
MAVQAHAPSPAAASDRRPGALLHRPGRKHSPRGLAIWVESSCADEAAMVHAAEVLLARVLRFVPEAEVHHWPASGTAQPDSSPGAGAGAGIDDESTGAEDTDLPPRSGSGPRTVSVDLATGTVHVDEWPVTLTGVEFRLLRYLVENCSRPIARSELQEFLESLDFPGCAPRSIDVYVARVRRKLGGARYTIATIRGGGYQFIPGPYAKVRGPAEYSI